jgi:hypothetical protein
MPSTINADNGVLSGITGIRTTADNSGNLALQANGITLLTVATNNTIVLGNTLKFADGTTANTAAVGGGGPGTFQAIQSANFTAVANSTYAINTVSSSVYMALPASPTAGQYVTVIDYAKNFATNNLVITPNGSPVEGTSNVNSSITTSGASVSLIYSDSTKGWLQYSGITQPVVGGVSVSYLLIAGGGAGGTGGQTNGTNSGAGGGGGGGGVLSGTSVLVPGTVYSFVIGAGGSASGSQYTNGGNGANSTALSLTAIYGGGGGGNSTGVAGGSGGGAGGFAGAGGSGTVGQGYAGGTQSNGSAPWSGCGGGGGGGAGGDHTTNGNGSDGGVAFTSSITGSAQGYAGGGAGGAGFAVGGGTPGTGGGSYGNPGTANTGGGGGGSSAPGNGGNGGSGVFFLSVPTAFYTGNTTGSPTVTTSGSNTILKYTSSGSYTA